MHRVDKIMSFILPMIMIVMGIVFYFVNPTTRHFPFLCLWKVVTGTQCPACGFQRAFHALIHGYLVEALSYNYFFVLSIPLAFSAILSEWYNYHHKLDWLWAIVHNRYTLITYVFLYFCWWILRNILGI